METMDNSMVIELYSTDTNKLAANMSDSMVTMDTTVLMDLNNSMGVNPTEMSPENVYILPLWQQFLWSLVFGTMVLVAAGGNIIVIWIVLAHKRMV
jgi:hypothetical protein